MDLEDLQMIAWALQKGQTQDNVGLFIPCVGSIWWEITRECWVIRELNLIPGPAGYLRNLCTSPYLVLDDPARELIRSSQDFIKWRDNHKK